MQILCCLWWGKGKILSCVPQIVQSMLAYIERLCIYKIFIWVLFDLHLFFLYFKDYVGRTTLSLKAASISELSLIRFNSGIQEQPTTHCYVCLGL